MELEKNRVEAWIKECRMADIYLKDGRYHEAQEIFEALGEKIKAEIRHEQEYQS